MKMEGVLEQFIYDREGEIKQFVAISSIENLHSKAYMKKSLSSLQEVFEDFRSLSLYDYKGNSISSSSLEVNISSVEKEAWFKEITTTGTYISSVFTGMDTKPTITIGTSYAAQKKNFIITATVGLHRLYEKLDALSVERKKGGTYIINPITGQYFSKPYFGGEVLKDKNELFNLGEKHYHVDYEFHGPEEVETTVYINPAGKKVLEGHCCILHGKWLVVVEQDVKNTSLGFSPTSAKTLIPLALSFILPIVGICFAVRRSN